MPLVSRTDSVLFRSSALRDPVRPLSLALFLVGKRQPTGIPAARDCRQYQPPATPDPPRPPVSIAPSPLQISSRHTHFPCRPVWPFRLERCPPPTARRPTALPPEDPLLEPRPECLHVVGGVSQSQTSWMSYMSPPLAGGPLGPASGPGPPPSSNTTPPSVR
jgi:hypothetical protein